MIEYYECMFCGYVGDDTHICENCGSDDLSFIEDGEDNDL